LPDQEVIHVLRSPTGHENQIFVMPAWIAGIHQIRKDASGDIPDDLIPALRAGMTQSRHSA
jgi:hypothetical protein